MTRKTAKRTTKKTAQRKATAKAIAISRNVQNKAWPVNVLVATKPNLTEESVELDYLLDKTIKIPNTVPLTVGSQIATSNRILKINNVLINTTKKSIDVTTSVEMFLVENAAKGTFSAGNETKQSFPRGEETGPANLAN